MGLCKKIERNEVSNQLNLLNHLAFCCSLDFVLLHWIAVLINEKILGIL